VRDDASTHARDQWENPRAAAQHRSTAHMELWENDAAPRDRPRTSYSGGGGGACGGTATKQEFLTLGFGNERQETVLERGTQIPNVRALRVHASTGYNRVEGNRKKWRNASLSDLAPGIPNVTIRELCDRRCERRQAQGGPEGRHLAVAACVVPSLPRQQRRRRGGGGRAAAGAFAAAVCGSALGQQNPCRATENGP
jgi:hypothetical protein